MIRYKNYKINGIIDNEENLAAKSSREAGLMIGYFIREILIEDIIEYECGECENYVGYRYKKMKN